jgi:hypothetical protein
MWPSPAQRRSWMVGVSSDQNHESDKLFVFINTSVLSILVFVLFCFVLRNQTQFNSLPFIYYRNLHAVYLQWGKCF